MHDSSRKVQKSGCKTRGTRGANFQVQRPLSRLGTATEYERFEQLPVWQIAIDLAVGVYALTEKVQFRRHCSLGDQIERVAVSISSHIAEGFEGGSRQHLLPFLYIARGSAGEVRSMLCLIQKDPVFAGLESEITTLKCKAENVSRLLGDWVQSMPYAESRR